MSDEELVPGSVEDAESRPDKKKDLETEAAQEKEHLKTETRPDKKRLKAEAAEEKTRLKAEAAEEKVLAKALAKAAKQATPEQLAAMAEAAEERDRQKTAKKAEAAAKKADKKRQAAEKAAKTAQEKAAKRAADAQKDNIIVTVESLQKPDLEAWYAAPPTFFAPSITLFCTRLLTSSYMYGCHLHRNEEGELQNEFLIAKGRGPGGEFGSGGLKNITVYSSGKRSEEQDVVKVAVDILGHEADIFKKDQVMQGGPMDVATLLRPEETIAAELKVMIFSGFPKGASSDLKEVRSQNSFSVRRTCQCVFLINAMLLL